MVEETPVIVEVHTSLTSDEMKRQLRKLALPLLLFNGSDYFSDIVHAVLIRIYVPHSVPLFGAVSIGCILPRIPLFANVVFDGLLKNASTAERKAEVLRAYWTKIAPVMAALTGGLALGASPSYMRWKGIDSRLIDESLPVLIYASIGLILESLYTPIMSLMASEATTSDATLYQLMLINLVCSVLGVLTNWIYLSRSNVSDAPLNGYSYAILAEESLKIFLLGVCLYTGSIRHVGNHTRHAQSRISTVWKVLRNSSAEITEGGLFLVCNMYVTVRVGSLGNLALSTQHAINQWSTLLKNIFLAPARASGILVAQHHALSQAAQTQEEAQRQLGFSKQYSKLAQVENLRIVGLGTIAAVACSNQIVEIFAADIEQINALPIIMGLEMLNELFFSFYRTATFDLLGLGVNVWAATITNFAAQIALVLCATFWIQEDATPQRGLLGAYGAMAVGTFCMATIKCTFFNHYIGKEKQNCAERVDYLELQEHGVVDTGEACSAGQATINGP